MPATENTTTTNTEMSREQMRARISLLSDEIDANDEKNRTMQAEIDSLYAKLDTWLKCNSEAECKAAIYGALEDAEEALCIKQQQVVALGSKIERLEAELESVRTSTVSDKRKPQNHGAEHGN